MEAILISLITHLSLLIVLFHAAHSATVTENNGVVADHWRQYHPNVQHLEDSIEQMAFSPETSSMEAPAPAPEPAPTAGGVVSTSSPDYMSWPFHLKQVNSPTNSPPSADEGDQGMPFINSNPTVPLPTGEADTVTIRPLPTSAHQHQMETILLAFRMPLSFMVFLVLCKG